MQQCRRYQTEDYEQICSWLVLHGLPAPEPSMLPSIGFIVPGVAVYFLYQTDGDAAYLENLYSNPSTAADERNEAIDLLVSEAINTAKMLGYKRALAVTDVPAVVKRALKIGSRTEGNKVLIIKHL